MSKPDTRSHIVQRFMQGRTMIAIATEVDAPVHVVEAVIRDVMIKNHTVRRPKQKRQRPKGASDGR